MLTNNVERMNFHVTNNILQKVKTNKILYDLNIILEIKLKLNCERFMFMTVFSINLFVDMAVYKKIV